MPISCKTESARGARSYLCNNVIADYQRRLLRYGLNGAAGNAIDRNGEELVGEMRRVVVAAEVIDALRGEEDPDVEPKKKAKR